MVRTEVALGAAVTGAALVLGVLWDAFETTVLSRRVSRRTQLTTIFYRITWPIWRRIARRFPQGNRRENFLTVYGPLSLLLLIALWAAALVLGFGLLAWGTGAGMRVRGGPAELSTAIYMSGTTLFTLGLGDVTPDSAIGRFLTVLESGIGLGFLALVIAYLPVLSQAFSARERNVALLDARAGSPPTATELLRRHGIEHADDALIELLRDWEHWSAQLLESHVSFPVLAFYRSQHDNQSWVAGLTAMLDTSALLISVEDRLDKRLTRQARLTFAMARHAVADMCRVLGRSAMPLATDRLPPEARARMLESLATIGVPLPSPDSASAGNLKRLRAMYEPLVHTLSSFLLMPLPPWVPAAPPRENWMTNL